MKEKANQRLKINLYLLLGCLPMLAFDVGRILAGAEILRPVTALHAIYAALVWTALAVLYIKTTPRAQMMDATCTMSMTWGITELIASPILWSLPKPPYAFTRAEFAAESAPWFALMLIFTFIAPFIGLELYRAAIRQKRPTGKRVIIIGGGISGLTAAVYAAKAGFDTLLLEQHAVAGGECTGWDRQGYHIDNCIHWMMGSNPGTALNKLWTTVGALDASGVVRADNMYTSHLNGEQLTLWQDIDRTEREMIALSPGDEPAIRELMADCRASRSVTIPADMPSELMGIRELMAISKSSGGSLKLMKKYKGLNVADLMARFRHPLIGCAISDFTPACSTASGFPMAYGNYAGGDGGIPVGGSRAMAQRMKAKAEGYGALVRTNCAVDSIIIENGHATGVKLANGSIEPCDYVIPACDASVTFGSLLDSGYMGKLMREIFQDGEAYPVFSTFQAAFAVDSAENIFPAEQVIACPELIFAPGMGERITVKSYAYEPSFAPAGKQILQTLQGGEASVYDMWKALYADKDAYRKKKLEIAETTREALEKNFPELKGKLTLLDAWTPMTYSRYCSAYKGFYQAPQITKRSAKMPYPPANIEGLDNVILAGQWLNLPGGLPGSAIAGKYAVQRVARLAGISYDM